jgi:hypothetical protein
MESVAQYRETRLFSREVNVLLSGRRIISNPAFDRRSIRAITQE